jgi:hypothetical protein
MAAIVAVVVAAVVVAALVVIAVSAGVVAAEVVVEAFVKAAVVISEVVVEAAVVIAAVVVAAAVVSSGFIPIVAFVPLSWEEWAQFTLSAGSQYLPPKSIPSGHVSLLITMPFLQYTNCRHPVPTNADMKFGSVMHSGSISHLRFDSMTHFFPSKYNPSGHLLVSINLPSWHRLNTLVLQPEPTLGENGSDVHSGSVAPFVATDDVSVHELKLQLSLAVLPTYRPSGHILMSVGQNVFAGGTDVAEVVVAASAISSVVEAVISSIVVPLVFMPSDGEMQFTFSADSQYIPLKSVPSGHGTVYSRFPYSQYMYILHPVPGLAEKVLGILWQ